MMPLLNRAYLVCFLSSFNCVKSQAIPTYPEDVLCLPPHKEFISFLDKLLIFNTLPPVKKWNNHHFLGGKYDFVVELSPLVLFELNILAKSNQDFCLGGVFEALLHFLYN